NSWKARHCLPSRCSKNEPLQRGSRLELACQRLKGHNGHMPRRTKIVATLGPATDTLETMEAIVRAGVDVVRLNFSHGEPAEHQRRLELVRQAAAAVGKDVGVLGDLQGPKIRIEKFKTKKVTVKEGQRFV